MVFVFARLSPETFQDLARHLVGKDLGITFEAFGAGRDSGIDGRYQSGGKTTILQIKHYERSPFSSLGSAMRAERKNVDQLKPDRYILATSVHLTPHQKELLRDIIGDALRAETDIYGADDLADVLRRHPEIAETHEGLWSESAPILRKIVAEAVLAARSADPTQLTAAPEVWPDDVAGVEFFGVSDIDAWRVLRWQPSKKVWKIVPIGTMSIGLGDCLDVLNTVDDHNHAKVVLCKMLPATFQAELTLSGKYLDVQLQISNGQDVNFNCNPGDLGVDIEERHKIVVTRVDGKIDFSVRNDRELHRLEYFSTHASTAMTFMLAIAVGQHERFQLHGVTLRRRKPETEQPLLA